MAGAKERYGDVCELLSLRPQSAPSLIDRQLRPALDELLEMGYISNWAVNRTSDNLDYKLVLYHGPKYLNDLKLLSSRSENIDDVVVEASAELIESLVQRGMSPRVAKKLLESLPADQPVAAQLEWCDSIIQGGRIENPAGFVYSVLENNEPVPEYFETSEKRNARLKREHEDMAAYALRLEREEQFDRYVQNAITAAISAKYSAEEYEAALKRFTPEIRKQYPNLPASTIRELSESRLKLEIRGSLPLLSIEEFISNEQFPLFS